MQRYASAVYALALCLCVSVTSRCYTKMAQWIELVFAVAASFTMLCCKKLGNSNIKGTSIWNFVQDFGLRKFHTASRSLLHAVHKDQQWSSFSCTDDDRPAVF